MELPESIQDIADVIGRERALYLIGQLPPCKDRQWRRALYVPTPARLRPDHKLVQILGHDEALKLCEALGGTLLQPAANLNYLRHYRDESLRRQHREGASTKVLACVFDMSLRNVRYILAGQ